MALFSATYMATTETTTLRVPVALRNRIAHIADERGTSLVEVVMDAVERLDRDRWWDDVHAALDNMATEDLEAYQREAQALAASRPDGLDE